MGEQTESAVCFDSARTVLRGALHAPVATAPIARVVFCHGYFQSNRIGPLSLYVLLARALAKAGALCLRFDMAGFGESDGDYRRASYDSMRDDLLSALSFAAHAAPTGAADRLGIIGHSLGGNLAIDVAADGQSGVQICLLSPNPTITRADVRIFTPAQLDELEATGRTMRKDIEAFDDVYRQINVGSSFALLRRLAVRPLLIVGDRDPYYSKDQYQRFAAGCDVPPHVAVISGADHNFLPTCTRPALIEHCVRWLRSVTGHPDEFTGHR